MINVTHIHPMLVHFPISLFFTSFFFDVLFKFTKNNDFNRMAYYVLILAVLSGIFATATGLYIEDEVESGGVSGKHIDDHKGFAIAMMVLFILLLSFRFFKKNLIPEKWFNLYLAIFAAGLVLLSVTGSYGGRLVYEDGAGVHVSKAGLKK